MQNLPGTLLSLGLLCFVTTILFFWVLVPGIIHWQIAKTMRLEEGNELWEAWTNIPVEVLLYVRIFNVTNPDEISKGSYPTVQEIGPYVYEEKRTKLGIRINLENDTITYTPRTMFYFRPDLSNGTEEDVITMVNSPLVSVGNELERWPRMFGIMAKGYFKSFDEKLFVQRTVKLALFEGVRVEMLEDIASILGDEFLPFNNTFGYFVEKNRTDPFELEISAGIQNPSTFGKIVSWKGEKKMKVWDGESCNMINGSDGTLFPAHVTKETVIYAFETDACRSMHMTYQKDDNYGGVSGYRFSLPKHVYGQENPNNLCFCAETDKAKCPKSGAVSLSSCKFGAPVLASNPHFLNGDSEYVKQVKGLNPNESLHDSFVILEPNTGIVLQGKKRVQMNIRLRKSRNIPQLSNVPEVTLPLAWIEEEAALSHNELTVARYRLVIPLILFSIGKWSFLAISTALTAVGFIIFTMRIRNRKHLEYY